MAMNLASKYSNKIDERFTRESQALAGTNKDYEWTGVKTINVYQVDTVPLQDYTRSGNSRYGTATELGNTIQSYTLTQDKSFTFTIDKGNKNETMMVMDAGKSLAREQREVMVPYVDKYIFAKQAAAAVDNGHYEIGAASTTTAYQKFLKAQEVLGNANVPDSGRIAFCSYAFCNLLMMDPAFIKYSDKSQEMTIKGSLGEVDGVKIVKVPASRLPAGCSFLLVHPMATTAPETLREFKTHDDPPGISGWLVEGRLIFDAFVLEGKKDALYIGILEGALTGGSTTSVASATAGKSVITYDKSYGDEATYYFQAGATAPSAGTFGQTFTTTGWTALTTNPYEATLTNGNGYTIATVIDGKLVGAVSGTVVSA